MRLTFIIIVIFLVISIEIEQMASCYNGRTIIIKWVMIYYMRKREKSYFYSLPGGVPFTCRQ